MFDEVDPLVKVVGVVLIVSLALFGGWAAFSGLKAGVIDKNDSIDSCQENHPDKSSLEFQDCIENVADNQLNTE